MKIATMIAQILGADIALAKPYTAYGIKPDQVWEKKKPTGLWVEVSEEQRIAIIDQILIKQKGYSHALGSSPPSVGGVAIDGIRFLLETPSDFTPSNINLARIQ